MAKKDKTENEELVELVIDMDVKCSRCEQKGATPSGLCLTCINAQLEEEEPSTEDEEIMEGLERVRTEEGESEGPVYSMELVQINFTKDEKIELGKEVADLLRRLKNIESQKKSATADFAAREKQTALEIDDLSRKIEDGFEMRRENCIVQYDDPTHMVHFIQEHDTSGVIIKQRKMTPNELQRALPGV